MTLSVKNTGRSVADDVQAQHRAIANERAKLTATYVNGLAITLFAVRGLSPFMVAAGAGQGSLPWGLGCLVVCSIFSGVLHSVARNILAGLDP